jgi:hypothetical protein
MSAERIAVPPELRAVVEAAWARGGGEGGAQLYTPEMPEAANVRLRWQRLWLERRRGAGGDAAAAEAALRDSGQRAVLALLDRQAHAVLLPAGRDGDAAWKLLEPRRGATACAEVWLAQAAGAEAPAAWCEWSAEPVSAVADRLCLAAAEVAHWARYPARTVVVGFAGGKDPEREATERLLATLRARTEVLHLSLYSPFYYRDEGLQAAALLAAVQRAVGAAIPVLCVPRLRGAELAAALRAAGGRWAGPLLCGAEAAAARLAPTASSTDAAATCQWLLRAADAGIDWRGTPSGCATRPA